MTNEVTEQEWREDMKATRLELKARGMIADGFNILSQLPENENNDVIKQTAAYYGDAYTTSREKCLDFLRVLESHGKKMGWKE